MYWIDIKQKRPPQTKDERERFVLLYHTIYGVGVGWVYVLDEGTREELEEECNDKYICSVHFIKNHLDGNDSIQDDDDIDVFVSSPHFKNLGTVTYWMRLPDKPSKFLNRHRQATMVGKKIKKLRNILEISQYDLEKMTGISQKRISLFETGNTLPKRETLEKLAKALKKPLSYFSFDLI